MRTNQTTWTRQRNQKTNTTRTVPLVHPPNARLRDPYQDLMGAQQDVQIRPAIRQGLGRGRGLEGAQIRLDIHQGRRGRARGHKGGGVERAGQSVKVQPRRSLKAVEFECKFSGELKIRIRITPVSSYCVPLICGRDRRVAC